MVQGVLCIVSTKQENGRPFEDGDVVRDTELNETFVYDAATDGDRALRAGSSLRLATEDERRELEATNAHAGGHEA